MLTRFALLAVLLVTAAQALAQQTATGQCHRSGSMTTATPQIKEARQNMRRFCAAEIATYCVSLPPCTGVTRCLNDHGGSLSPACATALQQYKATRRAVE